MGICATKEEKKNNKYLVEKLFPLTETKPNDIGPIKSEFYYLVEWLISFNFYRRLRNNQECSNISILNDDPKHSAIFKLIKAIDCPYLRDKMNSFLVSNDSNQAKQLNNNDKEQLKTIFFHLGKTNMTKLKKLLTDGPPNNMRWFLWLTLAKYGYEEVETKLNIDNNITFKALFSSTFDNVKEVVSNEQTNINSSDLFNSNFNYQTCLLNVIKAIVTYDKKTTSSLEVNNIVANVLIVSDFNEEEAFLIVRYIYSSEYGLQLRDFLTSGAPKLKYYTFIIDKLIESRCSQVYTYLNAKNLNKAEWVAKWIQSLYSFLDISSCIRVWDCVFALRCDFLIYFSLGCIKFCEKEILESQINDYNELNEVIKANINVEKVIKFALDFHISKETQIKFDHEFFNILIKEEEERQDNEGERNEENTSVIENNDDFYQEKINKIRVVYYKHFFMNGKGITKLSPEEKKSKMNGIEKMKEIYFNSNNSIDNYNYKDHIETQILCTLGNKTYDDYLREIDEEKKHQSKVTRNLSNNNINKTKSQKIGRPRVSFLCKSQNEFFTGVLIKKNYSLAELNNEDNSSSNLSSSNREQEYSIGNRFEGINALLNKKDNEGNVNELNDNMDSSIITPEDYFEDSYDEDAMIKMIEEKGIDSFLKENAPKKIVKVKHIN